MDEGRAPLLDASGSTIIPAIFDERRSAKHEPGTRRTRHAGHRPCYLVRTMSRSSTWFALGVLTCVAFVSTAEAAPKKKKKAAGAEPAKTEQAASSFDRAAAATALGEVSLQKCRATNAERGDGHVTITFEAAGSVQNVVIDKGPWAGTPVGKCMVTQFKKAKVPAFKGDAVTVGKSFRFE